MEQLPLLQISFFFHFFSFFFFHFFLIFFPNNIFEQCLLQHPSVGFCPDFGRELNYIHTHVVACIAGCKAVSFEQPVEQVRAPKKAFVILALFTMHPNFDSG